MRCFFFVVFSREKFQTSIICKDVFIYLLFDNGNERVDEHVQCDFAVVVRERRHGRHRECGQTCRTWRRARCIACWSIVASGRSVASTGETSIDDYISSRVGACVGGRVVCAWEMFDFCSVQVGRRRQQLGCWCVAKRLIWRILKKKEARCSIIYKYMYSISFAVNASKVSKHENDLSDSAHWQR